MSGVLRTLALLTAFGFSACQTSPVADTDLDQIDDRYDIILRSDVPLWMEDGTDAVSPRSFHAEGAFGCLIAVPTGNWKQTSAPTASGYKDDPVWWRVRLGGAIHCTGVFESGTAQGATDILLPDAGYVIDLGRDDVTGLDLYLWEIGVRTGSTYLVLSRREGDPEDQYNVLDPSCAYGIERRVDGSLSILRTDYCAIPDQAAMRATAREAASRPPTGLMQYVGPAPDGTD